MEKKRLTWMDMAKGYGILAVILAHLDYGGLRMACYTFHLPLFLFLSGYLFSANKSFGAFLKGKLRSIVLPYFCLAVPMALFDSLYQRTPGTSMWPRFFGELFAVVTQNRMWAIWYLSALFLVNLLTYFLVRTIKNTKVLTGVVVLLGVLGVLYAKLIHQPLFWNLDTVFPALPFFYAGYLCRKTAFLEEKILQSRRKIRIFAGAVAVDAACLFLDLGITGEYLQFYEATYATGILTYLGAFAGILAVLLLADAAVIRPLRYIGEHSLLYFAWHQTILFPLADLLYQKLGLFQQMFMPKGVAYLEFFVTTLFTCVVITLLNILIKKTPLRVMLGDFSKKPKKETVPV